jgi:putative ABC transport system permease protein
MALGAGPIDVLWLVIRQGLAVCAMGILAGVAGALALGRTLSTFLNGVSPTDPVAFLAAISIALLVAVAACVLPARRAVATNVSVGLRSD